MNLRKEASLAMGVSETTISRALAELNKMGKLPSSKQGQKFPQDFPEERSYVKYYCLKLEKYLKKAKYYWNMADTELIVDDDNDESYNFLDTKS
ncbi:13440_t:CDS:2 [Gigaspora margarita]|uniref:13440_t:CDS:1 n=1 Tax=Gigaspora margarita TaxID=4874 RepID=A0ABN7VIJ1_GIGMA|nr:13440_t:CDS:2 [Gigaspora margarita]